MTMDIAPDYVRGHREREIKTRGILFGNLNPVPYDDDVDPPSRACFNCWKKTHTRKNCPYDEEVVCHNCGMWGVLMSNCPRCCDAYKIWAQTSPRYLAQLARRPMQRRPATRVHGLPEIQQVMPPPPVAQEPPAAMPPQAEQSSSKIAFSEMVLPEPRVTSEDKAPEPTLALVPRVSQYPYPEYDEGPSEIKALPATQAVVQNKPQEYTAPFISYEIAPKLSRCVTMANELAQELARLPLDHAMNVRQFFANRCEDARNGTARIRPFELPAPPVRASQVQAYQERSAQIYKKPDFMPYQWPEY